VEDIYLPLSRLLNLQFSATLNLFDARKAFLGHADKKVPYIIGMAGSVAVGKSTCARILKTLLARWPEHPRVDLVTTDGFLLPNAELEKRGLMQRKGFPESYDRGALVKFLAAVKSGKPAVHAPLYSHLTYDVMPGAGQLIDTPDVLIVEGLNVLQSHVSGSEAIPYASDFFDFSIYIDAAEIITRQWYIERWLSLRQTAFSDERSYFHRYATLSDDEAVERASELWDTINGPNLRENIAPTRERADLILRKAPDHATESVSLRRI
jgi:type I pantothenate kinase